MLAPAALCFSPEGPTSLDYQDRYHGSAGALAQAQNVFLAGCGLPERWQGRTGFSVLETGFGLGFNFLATWQAWRRDAARSQRLDFLSIERHPVDVSDLARAHQAEPGLAELARQLRMRLPPRLPGCHRLEFEEGRVSLTLYFGDGASALAEFEAQVDAVFLDGFAPDRNPELWSAPVMAQVMRLARPGSRLATWCATGALRRLLDAHGYRWERAPGIAGKRETTRAVRQPSATAALPGDPGERSVIVVGAGVAGCQLAQRLCRRGWRVELLDAADGPASAASGNPAGVVRPLVSRDDNRVTRWTRAAFLYALQSWTDPYGRPRAGWHPGGALQLARDPRQASQWQQALSELALPGEYAAWLDAAQAAQCSGCAPSAGGLLFPLGGWVEPAVLCADALARCGSLLHSRWQSQVATLDATPTGWCARDGAGGPLASAAQLVLATGAGARNGRQAPTGQDFLPAGLRALQRWRGETTQLGGAALAALDLVICGDGYLAPNGQGRFTLGATYDREGDADLSAAGQAANLSHLPILTGIASTEVSRFGGRVAWRSVAADRVPLVGADPLRPGLWHLRALASRGLVWSPLAAELLAAEMNHDPSPLARSLRGLLSLQRPVLKEPIRNAPDPTARHCRQPAP